MSESFLYRRFFMHPAHESIGLSASATLRAEEPGLTADLDVGPRRLRACLVPGPVEEGGDEVAALVAAYLVEDAGLECCRPLRRAGPDPGTAGPWDCLVLLGRPAIRNPGQLQRLEQHCRRGGPLVAIRSADRGLPNWPQFAHDVLGGSEARGDDWAMLEIGPDPRTDGHPLLAGVEPFLAPGDPLDLPRLSPGAGVILLGHTGGLTKPVAWTHRYRGGRVFYSSVGSGDNFRQVDFLRLLANAIRWTAGR